MRFSTGIVKGDDGNTAVTGIDPATVSSVLKLKWDQGDAQHAELADRLAGPCVDADWAKSHDLDVGDTVHVHDAGRQAGADYEIAGTFKNQAGLTADVIAHRQRSMAPSGTRRTSRS